MPMVTVWSWPNGFPMAKQRSPTRALSEFANGASAGRWSNFHHSDICLRISAHDFRREIAAIGQLDFNSGCFSHVIVGQNVAGRIDNHAGAEPSLALIAWAGHSDRPKNCRKNGSVINGIVLCCSDALITRVVLIRHYRRRSLLDNVRKRVGKLANPLSGSFVSARATTRNRRIGTRGTAKAAIRPPPIEAAISVRIAVVRRNWITLDMS